MWQNQDSHDDSEIHYCVTNHGHRLVYMIQTHQDIKLVTIEVLAVQLCCGECRKEDCHTYQ